MIASIPMTLEEEKTNETKLKFNTSSLKINDGLTQYADNGRFGPSNMIFSNKYRRITKSRRITAILFAIPFQQHHYV